ncbi:protein-tyrosine phosphatase family protein [Vibrio parahaemolyticus]|uniref:protein-tyrosine phosphatase family protein n=1 Tax=Vibrio parahaemolyticus TaxID=670 RepID=UPI0006A65561|nr:protein-tyrosine phosphatase family protein [Vibrio parahaemolyticus]
MKSIKLFRAHVLGHSSAAEKLGNLDLASKIICIKQEKNEVKILSLLGKKTISTRQMNELKKLMDKRDKYMESEARIHNTKRKSIVPLTPSSNNTEEVAPPLPPRTYKNKVHVESVGSDAIGEKQKLFNRLNHLQAQLKPCFCPERYQQGDGINRFRDIQANKSTAVRSDLNANYVQVGTHRSIACQYPFESQLEKHLQMLFDNRTPVLAVLASDEEISEPKNKMPDYFRQDRSYGAMNVRSKLSESIEIANDIHVDVYRMTLTQQDSGKKGIVIPVVHVRNWPDRQALNSDIVSNISSLIDKNMRDKVAMYVKAGSSAVGDVNKLLPVVHCRAGVGRTGLVIGSLAMNEQTNTHLSLEDVVAEMRLSRNGVMVQTSDQLDELVKIAQQQGRSLLSNIDYSA